MSDVAVTAEEMGRHKAKLVAARYASELARMCVDETARATKYAAEYDLENSHKAAIKAHEYKMRCETARHIHDAI